MRKIAEEKREKVIALYKTGSTMKAIAHAEKVSEHTVFNILHEMGVNTRGRTSPQTKTLIVETYNESCCLWRTAVSAGVDVTTARTVLNNAGIVTTKKLSEDTVAKIIEMDNDGESVSSIAKILGVSASCIKGYLRENDSELRVEMNSHTEKEKSIIKIPEWISQAETLYREGTPYYKIAKIVGANRKTVSYYLRQKGFESNQKYVRHVDTAKLRKYDYSFENIFNSIDTPEKAYWLGLLYADGDISAAKNTISLNLKEADYEHLVAFKSFLGAGNKIAKKKKVEGDKEYIEYRIGLDSSIMKNDLIRQGCCPRKTFKILFPTCDQVPVHLLSHFVRGYYDGDGSIERGSNTKPSGVFELLGTEEFLIGFMKWTGLHHNSVNGFKHSDIKRVAYSGRFARLIFEKIYDNANFYLKRKHDQYLDMRQNL